MPVSQKGHTVIDEGEHVAKSEKVMVHRTMTRRTLETLTFDNTYARLPEAFYAKLNPTPFQAAPYLVHANPEAAALISLDPEEAARPEFAQLFGGSMLAPGMEPLAMLYSGHQFGVYVPQLGDGRAILLGEVTNEQRARWWPGCPALDDPRISLLRSDARPWHSDDARALHRGQ
jgi:hypothetical protein